MASDEDDDYMNMTFDEAPKAAETSLQRRQRQKLEGEIKGRVKSKAELAAEEREAREAALSTSMLDAAAAKKSKGFAMMAKMGFKKGGALGSTENQDAIVEPLRPEMRDDRGGVGLDSDRKRKMQDAAAAMQKKAKVDEVEFRDRVRRERETTRLEHQVYAAMKVCDRMDEQRQQQKIAEDRTDGSEAREEHGEESLQKKRVLSTRPLKSIPVVWRGLIRKREEVERDRRMKHDVQQGATRLPTYEDDSGEEDEYDRKAMGKGAQTAHDVVEDLDEEDPELNEFNALEPDERLRQLVEFLRKEYQYCFWCKFEYPDEKNMEEGCPGSTEEDHD
ncbi:putative G-patch domain protein [Xylariaceae sp. FL0255]|nr:putative G-patch domain protein [Xylariaceae sp. FL0255]